MNGESLIKRNRNQDYQNRNYVQVNLQKNNKKLSSQLKFPFPFIHGEKESILFAVAYNKQMSNFPVTFNVLNQNIIVNKAFLQYFTHHYSYFWCQIFLLICLFPLFFLVFILSTLSVSFNLILSPPPAIPVVAFLALYGMLVP